MVAASRAFHQTGSIDRNGEFVICETDPIARELLASNGYAIVELFTPEEIAEMLGVWTTLSDSMGVIWDPRGFFTSAGGEEWRAAVDDALAEHAATVASKFEEYEVFLSAFLVKARGAGVITPHIDWSFADEGVHPTYNCWVATSEIGPDSGALGIIPGSHHLVDFPRGAMDQRIEWASETFEDQAGEAVSIHLDAGQAVIYDNKLIHFSAPNATDSERVVSSFGLAHQSDRLAARAVLDDGIAELHELASS